MKRPLRVAISILTIGVCVVAGAVAGVAIVGYFGMRQVASNQMNEHASNAAFEAEILGRLRLGETDKAVSLLEDDLDKNVSSVRLQAAPPFGSSNVSTPDYVQTLGMAKAYRKAFPATQPVGRGIDEFLARVPDFHGPPSCNAAVCRLARSASTGVHQP